jgi:hypothetical protein
MKFNFKVLGAKFQRRQRHIMSKQNRALKQGVRLSVTRHLGFMSGSDPKFQK